MSQSKKRRAHTQQTQPSCDVFISYRRDGGDMTAMYFYQALKERGYRVFYDLEVLRSGSFNEALLHSIRSCTDFVLILSPHALDRCVSPDDWVRAEIAEALRLGKNIIPIMLKDFTFPEYLPEDIDAVRYQNGLTSTTEYFNESINRVCSRYLLSKPVLKKKKSSPVAPILLSIAAVLLLAAALIYWYMDNQKPSGAVPPTPPAPAAEEHRRSHATDVPVQTDVPAATDAVIIYLTPAPTEYLYQEMTPVPEITPVPQAAVPENQTEAAVSENEYVYPTDVPIILYETPIPLYNPSETQQTVTAEPAYTQEPQPIITPLPLVTPVQEQQIPAVQENVQQDITAGVQENTESFPADAAAVPEPVPADAAAVSEPVPADAAAVSEPVPADAAAVSEPVPADAAAVSEPVPAAPASAPEEAVPTETPVPTALPEASPVS